MSEPDFSGWSCPLPLQDYERIVLGHGGGGKLSAELVDYLFVPAFGGGGDRDSAVIDHCGGRLAFSTDSRRDCDGWAVVGEGCGEHYRDSQTWWADDW